MSGTGAVAGEAGGAASAGGSPVDRRRVIVARLRTDVDRALDELAEALRASGVDVVRISARGGAEAVAAAARQRADAIVVGPDVDLPEPQCRALLRRLKEAQVTAPVVAFGRLRDRDREVLRCLGVNAVAGPEVAPEDVAGTVRSLAEAHARTGEWNPFDDIAGGD